MNSDPPAPQVTTSDQDDAMSAMSVRHGGAKHLPGLPCRDCDNETRKEFTSFSAMCMHTIGLDWLGPDGKPVKVALYCQRRPKHDGDHRHIFLWRNESPGGK